jgi:hypothetical protein
MIKSMRNPATLGDAPKYDKIDGESSNAGKRGTNPAKGGRPKDIFEMGSSIVQ